MAKRFIAFLFSLSMVFSMLSLAVLADNEYSSEHVIYLDDGYYIVYNISENAPALQPSSTNVTRQKSGSAIGKLYDSSDTLIISLTVNGTFEYDGIKAEAISASYSYNVYSGGWTFESGNAYCDGDTAIATATFGKFLMRDKSLTVTLTCSPTGVLS